MIMTDQLILRELQQMPDHLKREVLDFIGFLLFKYKAPLKNEVPANVSLAIENQNYLGKEDIKRLYPDEWVLLTDVKAQDLEVLGGKVVLHDQDKHNLALRAQQVVLPDTPKRLIYTGQLPKHAKIGLMRQVK